MGDTVSVASTVYNLAGPESQRPNFLKSLIIGGIQQGADSLGEVIARGYGNSPSLGFRRFLKWSMGLTVKEYINNIPVYDTSFKDAFGLTDGDMAVMAPLNTTAVKAALPPIIGYTNDVDWAIVGTAQIIYWAQQYMGENHPDLVNTNYTVDYIEHLGVIEITHVGGGIETFVPVNYDQTARYLYAGYTPATADQTEEALQVGIWQTLLSNQNFRPTAKGGWSLDYESSSQQTVSLNSVVQTVIIYIDGSKPDSSSTKTDTIAQTYTEITLARYVKEVYQGNDAQGRPYLLRTIEERKQTAIIEAGTPVVAQGGQNRVVTTTTTQEVLVLVRQVRTSTQKIILTDWLPERVYIYKEGSGNLDLDALFPTEETTNAFYPPIPLRYDNTTLSKIPTAWMVKLPFAAAIGKQLSFAKSITDQSILRAGQVMTSPDVNGLVKVKDLESSTGPLVDVLTAPSPAVLEKRPNPLFDPNDPTSEPFLPAEWKALLAAPTSVVNPTNDAYSICARAFKKALGADYDTVIDNLNDNADIEDIDHAYVVFGASLNTKENSARKYIFRFFENAMVTSAGTDETQWWDSWNSYVSGGYRPPTIPWRTIRIRSKKSEYINYDIKLTWAFISQKRGLGRGIASASVGDVWLEVMTPPLDAELLAQAIQAGVSAAEYERFNTKIAIGFQETETTWRRLIVTGLYHENWIYKDKSEKILAPDALTDTTESGFLVPLHDGIYSAMSMVDRTQMATSCALILVNSYEIVKQPWYASTWFKVLIIVAIVIVSVIVAVATGGAGMGLLGSASTVGAAFGASGTTAIIIGAAVNALAALALGFIVNKFSISIFGERWGPVISSIAMTLLTFGLTSGNLIAMWDRLLTADGLMMLAQTTTTVTTTFMDEAAAQLVEDGRELWEKTNERIAEIMKMLEELNASSEIDASSISQYISELSEKPQDFLSRTLMSGSDIVAMSLAVLYDFTELSLRADLP